MNIDMWIWFDVVIAFIMLAISITMVRVTR